MEKTTGEIHVKTLDNIMIIDDDKMSQLLYKRVIEGSGLTRNVISIFNAQEALNYLGAQTSKGKLPELIFLDINMPVMDGWDYLDEFKKLDEQIKNKVKIAILSSSVSPEDKIKASSYKEVVDYVEKPLTPERISEIIEKYF